MNSLYKQSYLSSIGFTKFISGIHYLIELLAFQNVIEPFSLETLQPHISNKELLMILSSKSLTHSATTYFKSSLLETIQNTIKILEGKSDPLLTLESLTSELNYFYSLLDEATDLEEELSKLENSLHHALDDNDFELLKTLYKLIEETKLKDRFSIQTKIDELEIKLEQLKSSPEEKLDESDKLFGLTHKN